MFRLEIDSGSLNPCINEKIKIWITSDFFFVLNEKLPDYRIVVIGQIFREIIERNSCLQKQGLLKQVIGIIKGVSGYNFRNI